MSESWMPSDEELWDSVAPMVDFDHGDTRAMESVKLLIERAALKAQIEALADIEWQWSDDLNCYALLDGQHGAQLNRLRARLAELEDKP